MLESDREALRVQQVLAAHRPKFVTFDSPGEGCSCGEEFAMWQHDLHLGMVLAGFVRRARAEAWDEGYEAGERDVFEHQEAGDWDKACIRNPYCAAQDVQEPSSASNRRSVDLGDAGGLKGAQKGADEFATCARCGGPAKGYATIDNDRYCHEGPDPTCYMLASWDQSETRIGSWNPRWLNDEPVRGKWFIDGIEVADD